METHQIAISIDVSKALEEAKKNLVAFFPEFSGDDVRLEELDAPPGAATWRFTFSTHAATESGDGNPLAELLRPRRLRKAVEIDTSSGVLVSVKAA